MDGQPVQKQGSLPAVTLGRPSGSICPLLNSKCATTWWKGQTNQEIYKIACVKLCEINYPEDDGTGSQKNS